MTDAAAVPGVHRSVFVRLVAIMVVMAACLFLLVGGFFFTVVTPMLHEAVGLLVADYARVVAAGAPDQPTAARLGTRLGMDVRYEGPPGGWTTSPRLPSIDTASQPQRARTLLGLDYAVVPAPQGGRYLFAWRFGKDLTAIHNRFVAMVFVLMAVIVLVTHAVLRRMLRPLRTLADGVARLSEGQLDVVLPVRTRDEFGDLTDAFNRMVGRVKDMVTARDRLLVDVSHELRSPVTRLKVALELLPESGTRARMDEDVAEMEAMLGELLELERLRDGRGLAVAVVDVVSLVREVADRFTLRAPGVRVTSSAPSIAIAVDGDKVRTVVRNLIENALKYSLPDSRAVSVAVETVDGGVRMVVVDDGPGIPGADLANVFEPFYRVDRSRSRRTGGYGLGLSICKRIVDAHGGTLAVANNPCRGATFTVWFPARP